MDIIILTSLKRIAKEDNQIPIDNGVNSMNKKTTGNINILTQSSVLFALEHNQVFVEQSTLICQNRSQMHADLSALPALKSYPSRANFILFKTLKHSADTIFQRLKEQKVLIKNLSPQGRALTNCLRVTIGKTNENKAFLNALKKALK